MSVRLDQIRTYSVGDRNIDRLFDNCHTTVHVKAEMVTIGKRHQQSLAEPSRGPLRSLRTEFVGMSTTNHLVSYSKPFIIQWSG